MCFEVEKKRIEVKFEGIQEGTWVSIAEKSRGLISLVGLEREEIVWIQEQLQKVVELKDFLGFIKKYREKTNLCVGNLFQQKWKLLRSWSL